MKKHFFKTIALVILVSIFYSCNNTPVQKTETKLPDERSIPTVEVFDIDKLFGKWELDKNNIEENYANFIGDRNVHVVFNANSKNLTNILIDTAKLDTTLITLGYTIEDRLITVYDLDSQELVTKSYIKTLTNKVLGLVVNYNQLGSQYNLEYSKLKK